MEPSPFGAKLGLVLKALSINRARLAADLAVHKSVVSRWVSGVSAPSPANLERLTALVAARRAGFTTLDWESDVPELSARLGIAPPALVPEPASESRFEAGAERSPFGAWLPPSMLEEVAVTTRQRGFAYEGFWRITRPAPQMPGRFLHDYTMLWTAPNGMLMQKLAVSGYSLTGWCLPLRNQLFGMAAHEPSGLLVFSVFNGVPRQKAVVIDGLTLSCLLDAGGSPVAGAAIMERIGELSGDLAADQLRFRAYRQLSPLAPDGSVPQETQDHLYKDVGPAAAALGGDSMLLLRFGSSVARAEHLGYAPDQGPVASFP